MVPPCYLMEGKIVSGTNIFFFEIMSGIAQAGCELTLLSGSHFVAVLEFTM